MCVAGNKLLMKRLQKQCFCSALYLMKAVSFSEAEGGGKGCFH